MLHMVHKPQQIRQSKEQINLHHVFNNLLLRLGAGEGGFEGVLKNQPFRLAPTVRSWQTPVGDDETSDGSGCFSDRCCVYRARCHATPYGHDDVLARALSHSKSIQSRVKSA